VLPRRIYVNLGAFVVLFVILMVWAVLGIIRPAALQDTYPLRLEFVDATGLRPGVEATYRGVRVGEVIEVSLADGGADVRLAVDADRRLPAGATAAIRRRSAVGEPYVSLDAPEGWESGDAMLAAGDEAVIPAERTSTGVAYGTLFDAAEELLVSVDKDDLRTLTAELGTALRGQGDELRRILRNTSDTASSFAERKDELDQLAGELTALTRLLADKSTTIADSTDDVSALVGSLASSADDIDTLLARTPAVASRLDELLVAAYGDLRCMAAGAASISNVSIRCARSRACSGRPRPPPWSSPRPSSTVPTGVTCPARSASPPASSPSTPISRSSHQPRMWLPVPVVLPQVQAGWSTRR
jgi:phospholipid/cholesterol/gamma-HCH transport system substrate-binding protein